MVPAYNEADRLPRLFAALDRSVDLAATQVIVVDDGSSDATADVASLYLQTIPSGHLVMQPKNQGKGRAVAEGVLRARGEKIAFMDADSATDLDGLDGLLAALEDHDIAIGSRSHAESIVEHAHQHRAIMGRAFNHLTRSVTGLSLRDTQCGFKAFRAPVAKLLFAMSDVSGFAFDVAVLTYAHRLGFSIAEVPIRWRHVPGSKIRRIADPMRMAADALTAALFPAHTLIDAVRVHGVDEPRVRELVHHIEPALTVTAGLTDADILVPPNTNGRYGEVIAFVESAGLAASPIVHDSADLLRRGHGTGLGTRPSTLAIPDADALDGLERTRQAGRRILRHGKNAMGLHPATLPILLRMTPTGTSRQLRADTHLVVEGFPRSGNTFTAFALQHAGGSELNLSSHVHHPSQVKLAVARGIPTVLVIREPVGTLASYLIAGPHGRARGVLKEYISYYSEVLPLLDDVLVVRFEDITTDMGSVTRRINARFDLSIPPFEHVPDNVDAVYRAIKQHHDALHGINEGLMARPVEARKALNQRHRDEIQSPELEPLLERATRLYEMAAAAAH